MIRVQSESSLAKMHEALRNADHEEVVLVLGVVLRQLPQDGGQAGVVGAGTDQAEAEDGVVRDLRVLVVRELC